MRVHGIMPPLLSRPDKKFWYDREHESGNIPEPGMPVQRSTQGVERNELTEVVAAARGETPGYPGFEQQPVPVSEANRVQIYTDGTVDIPQKPAYAVGGAAAWRREGQEEQEAGRKRDEAAIKKVVIGDGTAWLAAVLGRVQSSTRAEVLAGLMAAVGENPIDIYTDSKCFINMHRQACARIAGKRQPPFSRQKNGDLARAWHDMLKKRGPWSVNLYWVKGHTGEQYRDWGLTREQEQGNKTADEAALHAREFQGEDFRALANWAEAKHSAYDKLAKDYDSLAVQTIMESTRRDKARNKGGQQEGTLGVKKVRIQAMKYCSQGGRTCKTTAGQKPGKPASEMPWEDKGAIFICNTNWMEEEGGHVKLQQDKSQGSRQAKCHGRTRCHFHL